MRRLTPRPVLAALLALVVFLSYAQLPGSAASDGAATAGTGPITVRVRTPEYQLDAAGLRVSGYTMNDVPGAPRLPVYGTVVELPAEGGWTTRYEAGQAVTLTVTTPLPAVPTPDGDFNVWAALQIQSASGSTDDALPTFIPTVDRPDPAIYAADAFYPPSPVQEGRVAWQGGRRLLAVRVFPFQYNPVRGVIRYYPDLRVTVTPEALVGSLQAEPEHVRAAVTAIASPAGATGALRIRTSGRGIYRLTWNDLVTAGVPVTTTAPTTFAMSYLGEPIDIQVMGEADGRFDPGDLVIFYAEPYVGRYMTQNVYWFTWGGTGGARMATRAALKDASTPTTVVTETVHFETNLTYYSAFTDRPKEADHWFDNHSLVVTASDTTTKTVPFSLTLGKYQAAGEAVLRVLVHGGVPIDGTPDRQAVQVKLNGHLVGVYPWDGGVDHAITARVPAAWLVSNPNVVELLASRWLRSDSTSYLVYPDWVELTYGATAAAAGDRRHIEAVAPGAAQVAVSGFTSPAVRAYDIRASRHPVQLTTTQADPVLTTYTLRFWDTVAPDPAYFLSTQAALAAPAAIEPDTPSSWGTPANNYDYIAIVHRSLWDAIQPLLDYRADPAKDNMRVAKVDVQDIYDEFSYGRVDPEAIRSFLSYAYQHWNAGGPRPRYVLLVGNGTYNFTGVAGWTSPNLIPPYLINIDPWYGETAADNRFVSVDGPDDFLPEMAIGRISAQSPAEVTAVVSKILAYEALPAGDWQRRVVFVADNCADGAGDFNAFSEEVRQNWLPAGYDRPKVYYGNPQSLCPLADYDNLPADEMRPAIIGAFNQQALLIQWFGHASQRRWGSVSMFNSVYDVPALADNTVWPFTTSYSCLAGYFIQDLQSLAEALTSYSAKKGSVVDLSPSGLHVGESLRILNKGIIKAIFQDRIARAGDAVNAGKLFYWQNAQSYLDVIDTSILFGDPALKLRLPPLPTTPTVLPPQIDAGTDQVKLTWTHLPENTGYEVWRSLQPYFIPGAADSKQVGYVAAPTSGTALSFTDATVPNGLGDVSSNYFYAVRGINPLGASTVGAWDGEFDFAITPGQ